MDLILEGIKKAFSLIFTLDGEVLGITLLSLKVSGTATLISLFIGISVGTAVALSRFPGTAARREPDQHGDGAPAGRRRPLRDDLPLAERAARFPGDPLHADGDHPGPGRHRHPDRHGDHPGVDPAPAGEPPSPDPRPGRHARPDGLAPGQGGAPAAAGGRDGRVRRRHLGGRAPRSWSAETSRATPGS